MTFIERLFSKRWYLTLFLLVIFTITAGMVFALPRTAPAHASGATITVSPTSGAYSNRDDQVPITIHGSNYGANETVNIYWNYQGAGTGILEVTTSTNSKGTFVTSFLDQLAAHGTYTIAGVGQTSGDVATGTFTLFPNLYIRPQAAGPASSVTFYGNAFDAGENVNVYWNYKGPGKGLLLTTATGDSNGAFAATTNIPANVKPNSYLVAAVGQSSNLIAKYKFTIYTPTLALAPLSGSDATGLTVSAYGFTGSEQVDIFWNGGSTPVNTVTTSPFGYLSPTTITVPAGTAPGSYVVKTVGRSSHIAATNSYTVVAPSSSLSVTSGPVGTVVNVTGQGYTPGETAQILWNYTGPGTGTNVGSLTAGYSGTIQGAFNVPVASTGSYKVAVAGNSSNRVTQNSFLLNNSVAANPSTTPPGTKITMTGSGYQANESVQIFLNSSTGALLATLMADNNGNINHNVTIPAATTPGVHNLVGVGQSSGNTFSTTVSVDTAWGDFGFDYAHHRENYYENQLNTSNVANLQLKWSAATAVGLKDTPVYANGAVYIATMDGRLNAYNATTGALKWQFNCTCIFRSYPSPLVDPGTGMVFFGTVGYADEGIPSPFYALDAQTGALKWSVILPWHQLGFPTLAFNTLYVGISHLDHGSCAVYALDEISGHIDWLYTTDAGAWGAVAVDTSTHTIFTGLGNDDITHQAYGLALNALTGALVWQQPIPMFGPDDDVGSGITINNGSVYLSSKNGRVYALNEGTGAITWSTAIGVPANGDISTQAISSQGTLYVGSINGYLYALNASTGTILWRVKTGGPIFSSPAIANGVVYFASLDHKFYAVDASTGTILWSYTTGSFSYSSPTVVNGWLYCGSGDGKLYAFSL